MVFTLCIACLVLGCPPCALPPQPATFTLWQLPSQPPSQMMAYVLRGTDGQLVVVDGGTAGGAPYLRELLAALGNHVSLWIVTHPHSDHVGTVNAFLDDPGSLVVDRFCATIPDADWQKNAASDETAGDAAAFIAKTTARGILVLDVATLDAFWVGGMRITILGVRNPAIQVNPINSPSMVFRVEDGVKSVLFTGDLGLEGGDKLLNGPYAKLLRADYVQMAHHGQTGVSEAFYIAVGAKRCLWPKPLWLWENDNGGGKGSGPWRILETRAWMDKLAIDKHYVAAEGLSWIE